MPYIPGLDSLQGQGYLRWNDSQVSVVSGKSEV